MYNAQWKDGAITHNPKPITHNYNCAFKGFYFVIIRDCIFFLFTFYYLP